MEHDDQILRAAAHAQEAPLVLRQLAAAIHDMAQPLTALQCRLEIGRMLATPAAFEEAVIEGIRESERLLVAVSSMRELIRHAIEQR